VNKELLLLNLGNGEVNGKRTEKGKDKMYDSSYITITSTLSLKASSLGFGALGFWIFVVLGLGFVALGALGSQGFRNRLNESETHALLSSMTHSLRLSIGGRQIFPFQ